MKSLYGKKITNKYVLWLLIPLVIILIAASVFTGFAIKNKDISKGLNIGIDFSGGSIITVILGEDEIGKTEGFNKHLAIIKDMIENDEVEKEINDFAAEKKINLPAGASVGSISYSQKSDTGEAMAIIVKYDNISKTYDKTNILTAERNKLIEAKLREYYSEENGFNGIEVNASNIGATASTKLIQTALLAVGITLVLILIYIIIRFEVWSGIAAIVALAHDVIMMIALTAIFRIQINSAFIAAMITIVSYSINNTIVVFDRVREDMKNEKGLAKGSNVIDNNRIVDNAAWETLTRSFNSTVTTMVAIVIFAILGAASVREFALPVIFGLIAGFYSSLVIAPSLYCLMKNAADKHKRNKGVTKTAVTTKEDSKKKYAGM